MTAHKTAIFILVTVKTWNLINSISFAISYLLRIKSFDWTLLFQIPHPRKVFNYSRLSIPSTPKSCTWETDTALRTSSLNNVACYGKCLTFLLPSNHDRGRLYSLPWVSSTRQGKCWDSTFHVSQYIATCVPLFTAISVVTRKRVWSH
jgi:hypothetical protein